MNLQNRYTGRALTVGQWLVCVCAAAAATAVRAAPASDPAWLARDPIVTERPSFSASPLALAPQRIQLEGGYQFTDTDANRRTLPLALLRVGIRERLELQLSWAGVNRLDGPQGSVSGQSDAGAGLKWQLSASDSTVPLAVFAGATVPTGDAEFSSDRVDVSAGVFWSYSGALDWFGTTLVTDTADGATLGTGIGISVPLAARTGSYLEYVNQIASRGGPAHSLNSGITFTPRGNLQWDINISVGLNDRAADLILGAGVAYKL